MRGLELGVVADVGGRVERGDGGVGLVAEGEPLGAGLGGEDRLQLPAAARCCPGRGRRRWTPAQRSNRSMRPTPLAEVAPESLLGGHEQHMAVGPRRRPGSARPPTCRPAPPGAARSRRRGCRLPRRRGAGRPARSRCGTSPCRPRRRTGPPRSAQPSPLARALITAASTAMAASIGPTLMPTLGMSGGMRVKPSSSTTGCTIPDQVS